MFNQRSVLRFATYALVGAVGTLAQYAILVASVSMHWLTPVVASVIGAVVGANINYILNSRITFHRIAHSSALPKFALTALLGAILNGLTMMMLIDFFFANYLVAQIISTVIVLGVTYCINLVWTFRCNGTGLDTQRL